MQSPGPRQPCRVPRRNRGPADRVGRRERVEAARRAGGPAAIRGTHRHRHRQSRRSPLFKPIALHGRTSSEAFARLVPDERVVKAFNHLRPASRSADPVERGGRRVLFLAGDDARTHATVTTVAALIDRLGFAGIDLGTLAEGGRRSRFPGRPSSALKLVRFD